MIDTAGITLTDSNAGKQQIREIVFENANNNPDIWTQLMWMSGGKLNSKRCFS